MSLLFLYCYLSRPWHALSQMPTCFLAGPNLGCWPFLLFSKRTSGGESHTAHSLRTLPWAATQGSPSRVCWHHSSTDEEGQSRPQLGELCSWLAKYMAEEPLPSSSTSSSRTCGAQNSTAVLDSTPHWPGLWEADQEQRRCKPSTVALRQEHFRTPMLGGAWRKSHTSQNADAIKISTSSTASVTFCSCFHMPKQVTFAIQSSQ